MSEALSPTTAAPVSRALDVRHRLPALRSLTAIRFFAAIDVVLFHESHWTGHIPLFRAAARVVNSGYTSVTLFFVLSGFILAYNYERMRSRGEFWVSRFARIYPVYLLSLLPPLLITPHWSYHPHPGALGLLLTFVLLQAWVPGLAFSLNLAAWTLSVEAFFYAVFPFLLPWVERLRARGFVVLQVMWLVVVTAPLVMSVYGPLWAPAQSFAGALEGTLPIVRLNAFFLGMYAGVQFRRSLTGGGRRRMARSLQPACVAGAVGLSLFLLWLQPTVLYLPLRTEALQLTYAGLIWLLADVEWRLLTNRTMQLAGEISYSIYILQFPVLFAYDDLMHRVFPRTGHMSLVYIGVLCAASYVIFRWVEMPARLLIRRAVSGRPVAVREV